MRLGLALTTAALVVLTAGVRADIVVTSGPGNVAGDENVLFNQGTLTGTGTTVQGQTQQSGFVVDFTSPTVLTTPAAGQARVSGNAGMYTDLTVGLNAADSSFTSLIVNINAAAAGTVDITTTEWDATTTLFPNLALAAGGQNFFIIEAINNQRLDSVRFVSTVDVEDFRQIRIGGAARNAGVVPEPGSLALLALGGLPLLGLRRRK